MPLNLNKPVETRSGKPVRIICTDKKGSIFPIVALVTTSEGVEHVYSFNREGVSAAFDRRWHLVNVAEKRSEFKNVWKNSCYAGTYTNVYEAVKNAEALPRSANTWKGVVELKYEGDVLVGGRFLTTEQAKKEAIADD